MRQNSPLSCGTHPINSMTLAVIIALGTCLFLPPASVASPQDAQAQQNEPAAQPAQTPQPPNPDVPPEKPAPPSATQPSSTQPSATQEKSCPSGETASDKSCKTKKQSKKSKAAKDATPAPAAQAPPSDAPKVVIKEGSTPEPTVQLSQGMPENQIPPQKKTTDLLSDTDVNLKKISAHQLNASQQDVVTQIHTYIDQAKAAVSAGDEQRGHLLANKAYLLSEELLKR